MQLRKLSNSAQYAKAYKLAAELKKNYPKVLFFAYYEAVMTAEDNVNFTQSQIDKRYKLAAQKFRKLLYKTRWAEPRLRKSIKNEYYWFSMQHYKQYLLGVKEVKAKAFRGGYYSQGVGAAMLSKKYAFAGKKKLAVKWAEKSEKCWLKFFAIDPKWFNAYSFYARSLGYQNRLVECDKALAKAARIAKRPKNWNAIKKYKKDIMLVHHALYG